MRRNGILFGLSTREKFRHRRNTIMRILVVEDSVLLQKSLCLALRKSGHLVDGTGDGEEGLWLAQGNPYDVIVLDWMLPGRDGISVVQRLREEAREVRVLMLTARDAVADRVDGLESGADDYLVKPFAMAELLARVQALGRRGSGGKRGRLQIDDLEIDLVRRTATRAGIPLELTAREYQLLEYLARKQGAVVSRREIEAHIYDDLTEPMSNVVDSAICILRKKMAVFPETPSLIRTRRGMGYMLGGTGEDA